MTGHGRSATLESPGERQHGRVRGQQMAARELVDAVGQLLREAVLPGDSEPWWGDRLRVFSEAAGGLVDAGALTDEQALELLYLLVAQIGEAEVNSVTSDLLDTAFENVGRPVSAGFGSAPGEKPRTRIGSGRPLRGVDHLDRAFDLSEKHLDATERNRNASRNHGKFMAVLVAAASLSLVALLV